MQKETLTLPHIAHDLRIAAQCGQSRVDEWRLPVICASAVLAVLLGIILKNVWVALPFVAVAVYQVVRYVQSFRVYKAQTRAIEEIIDRGDISISVEKLSHIAEEVIYEPHSTGRHHKSTRTVTFFYFESGISWRLLSIPRHYAWSKEHYVSPQGLMNISLAGDEFYYVSLQGHGDIAYVYPCKNFKPDSRLQERK